MLGKFSFLDPNLAFPAGLSAAADRLQFHSEASGSVEKDSSLRNISLAAGRHEDNTASWRVRRFHRDQPT
jgi:hypothetical protein